jgi:hypothetical protein
MSQIAAYASNLRCEIELEVALASAAARSGKALLLTPQLPSGVPFPTSPSVGRQQEPEPDFKLEPQAVCIVTN